MIPVLVTAGGVLVDCVVAADGALHRDQIGGNAVYAAIGARAWLGDVGLVGRVPGDYPRAALDGLLAARVQLAGVHREPATSAWPEWFFYEANGARRDQLHASRAEADAFGMVGERVAPDLARRFADHLAANPEGGRHGFAAFRQSMPVEPRHVPVRWWGARAIHLGANRPDALLALATMARRKGLIVSCDPGAQARALDAATLDALLGLVDVFLPSEVELAILAPGLAPEAGLRSLAARARGAVVLKQGAKGALVWARGAEAPVAIPALPVLVRDPTGAGDAFAGGLLAGLATGDDIVTAAKRGTVSASLAVQAPGALAPLDTSGQEVMSRFRSLLPP